MSKISEKKEPARFKSKHWVHARTGDGKELITISGIILADFKGAGQDWKAERYEFEIKSPSIIPAGKALQVEQWCPLITLNAIHNRDRSYNAGWAVDKFGGPGATQIITSFDLWANLAVRDIDGFLFRVGYTVTLLGNFVDNPLPRPK